jgi:hypothetical protein
MPTLTNVEIEYLRKFSNKLFDFLFQDLNLSEKRADEIAEEVIALIQKKAENK